MTTVVVIFYDTRLSFHFRDTGNQHNHRLTNESKTCILMASHKSHNATVRGSPFAGFATNKNTKRSTSTATGCVKISKYQSCFQLDFNVSYFALKWEEIIDLCYLRTFTSDIEFGHFFWLKDSQFDIRNFIRNFDFALYAIPIGGKTFRPRSGRHCFPVIMLCHLRTFTSDIEFGHFYLVEGQSIWYPKN